MGEGASKARHVVTTNIIAYAFVDIPHYSAKEAKEAARKNSQPYRLKAIADRNSGTICFACRETGHAARDCSTTRNAAKGDPDAPGAVVGICYRCGSSQHTLSRCKERVDPEDPMPFASCFVCSGKGHLASGCPQNGERGVYPNGGSCKLCGKTTHLARDCDLHKKVDVVKHSILGVVDGADEDDFHALKRRKHEVDKEEKGSAHLTNGALRKPKKAQHGVRFTPINGQDTAKPLPYDPSTPIPEQIKASFRTSLANLRTTYVDSYLLHSPLSTKARTLEAWRALMGLQDAGMVRMIGVSNVYDVGVLRALAKEREVQVVQNRWYEGNEWDRDVYGYCRAHGILYQSFWTLSGSPSLLKHPKLVALAKAGHCTPEQVIFKLAMMHGIVPLTGTKSEAHMKDDLGIQDIELREEESAIADKLRSVGDMVFGEAG
ncbi:hypothetical protein EYR40_006408 [Pleurotus pulmonarius]|nr:hypothetical protein EYR36_011029 [Pleurotus pulmonarius]KAF4599316.1 hypothetical protein EYR40_006408 [Pleurotus pulmonarius]